MSSLTPPKSSRQAFPSGHTALSAATYLALGGFLASLHRSRGLKIYFLSLGVVLTIAIGLTRVYLGVHYPTDVLAGWCIGAAWAILCWLVWARFQDDRKPEPQYRECTGG